MQNAPRGAFCFGGAGIVAMFAATGVGADQVVRPWSDACAPVRPNGLSILPVTLLRFDPKITPRLDGRRYLGTPARAYWQRRYDERRLGPQWQSGLLQLA